MLNIVIFGPPGSGKGTQAAKIADKYSLIHISTGDLFRHEMSEETPLGVKAREYISRGQLVPDSVTIAMLHNKLEQHPGAGGFIFDGFPRTTDQAEALDELLAGRSTEVTCLIALEVPEEEIIRRILLRGETSGRTDDSDTEIIKKRIAVYREETEPVSGYYAKQDKAYTIDGVGSIAEIFERLCIVIEKAMG